MTADNLHQFFDWKSMSKNRKEAGLNSKMFITKSVINKNATGKVMVLRK